MQKMLVCIGKYQVVLKIKYSKEISHVRVGLEMNLVPKWQ